METACRLFGPKYHERIGRHGDYGNACAVCGRPTKQDLFVNADGGPEWYGDDMGWHPIGSDCAKKATKAGWEVQALEAIT